MRRLPIGLAGLSALVLLTGLPGAARAQESAPSARPGLFKLGPVFVTPTLRVGQVGYDSNVFFTQDDQTGDFVASGGPGLELVLPLGRDFEVGAETGVNILYFAETESLRRTTWQSEAFLRYLTPRTRANLSASYAEEFKRPDFEVNDRVLETRRRGAFDFRRGLGRNEILGGFETTQLEVEDGQVYRGADLARNLNRTTYRGLLGFGIGLTPKTSFIIEADHQADRFEFETSRDLDSNRIYGGFRLTSLTRLSGRAVAGARRLRPLSGSETRWFPYIAVLTQYRFGPKTALWLRVDRDQDFSAFRAAAGTQTSKRLTSELGLGRQLWGPLDIRLFGGYRGFETDGAVEIELEDGSTESGIRKDDEWYGGADLGFRFRDWFRVGFTAQYSDRSSSFSDLGVDGLLLGFTIRATPGDIIDLAARN